MIIKEGLLTNSWLAYRLIDLLSSEFKDWEAAELGIIDKDGNTIKKPKTREEKDSFGMFQRSIRKIKQIINKFMGSSKASAIMSTLYLMKETIDDTTMNMLLNEIKTLYPDVKTHITKNLMESTYSCNRDVSLKPGKYFLNFVDGEEKIVITEEIYPIDIFYGYDIYSYSGVIFTRDQIRRVIGDKNV